MEFNIMSDLGAQPMGYDSRIPDLKGMPHIVLVSVSQKWLMRQIREFLHDSGHRVVEAPTEDAAIRILDESGSEVGLLLADAQGQDAPRLARHAMRNGSSTKVLLISGEPDYVNRTLVPESQIDFIEKPFAWCDLKRKIDQLLAAESLKSSAMLGVSVLP